MIRATTCGSLSPSSFLLQLSADVILEEWLKRALGCYLQFEPEPALRPPSIFSRSCLQRSWQQRAAYREFAQKEPKRWKFVAQVALHPCLGWGLL